MLIFIRVGELAWKCPELLIRQKLKASAFCCGVPPPPDFMPEIPGVRHRKPELSNQGLMKKGFLGRCMFGMSLLSTQCELHPSGRVLAEGFSKRASPCCSSHAVPPTRLLPRESRDTPKIILCPRNPSKRTSQAFSESTWARQASPAWFLDTSSTSRLPVSYLHLTCLVRARIFSISVLPPGSVCQHFVRQVLSGSQRSSVGFGSLCKVDLTTSTLLCIDKPVFPLVYWQNSMS